MFTNLNPGTMVIDPQSPRETGTVIAQRDNAVLVDWDSFGYAWESAQSLGVVK
jgi:hypothetical protein